MRAEALSAFFRPFWGDFEMPSEVVILFVQTSLQKNSPAAVIGLYWPSFALRAMEGKPPVKPGVTTWIPAFAGMTLLRSAGYGGQATPLLWNAITLKHKKYQSKHQIPKHKFQTNHNVQKPNLNRLTPAVLVIGNLDLEFVWDFGFEICDFEFCV